MSLKTTPRPATAPAGGRVIKAILTGIGGAVLGALLGLIIGANIGGNWFTSVSIGGQHGYEATALLGAVAGGVALGAVGVWLALRRRHLS